MDIQMSNIPHQSMSDEDVSLEVKLVVEKVMKTIEMTNIDMDITKLSNISEESIEDNEDISYANLDDTYYEAHQSFQCPDSTSHETPVPSPTTTTITTDSQTNDETNRCQSDDENEKDHSPKHNRKDADYKAVNQVSSDWKYSSSSSSSSNKNSHKNNEYDPFDYYKSIGTKYDNLLTPWSDKKDNNFKHNSSTNFNPSGPPPPPPVRPSRGSLLRGFDPLNDSRYKSTPESPKEFKKINNLNESSDLADMFGVIRIAETPQCLKTNNYTTTLIDLNQHNNSFESKAKMIEMEDRIQELEQLVKDKDHKLWDKERELSAIKEDTSLEDRVKQMERSLAEKDATIKDISHELLIAKVNVESEDRIKELENKLRDRQQTLQDMEQQLMSAKQENEKLLSLNNVFHHINDELVRMSKTACDSIADDRNKLSDELMTAKKCLFEMQTQYSNVSNKLQELHQQNQELKDRCAALDRQHSNFRDTENELMSFKIQQKKYDMKINSLEKQFEQKCNENKQLSEMVDELIVKVRN